MKKRGLSLIEVTVATAILALILGGMLGIFGQGFASARQSQERAVAYNLARSVLEDYFDWSRISVLPLSIQINLTPENINNIIYSKSITVSNQGPYGTLRRIRAVISWNSGSFSLETFKSAY